MGLAAVLPLAFVVVAGPQVISAVFLATGARWAAASASYVAGAALSVLLVVTVAYIAGDLAVGGWDAGGESGASEAGETMVDVVVLLLVALLVGWVFWTRHTPGPPGWMGRLQEPRPGSAFELGAALCGLLPASVGALAAAGLSVPRHGHSWWGVLPFSALTLLLLAAPALSVAALGPRAARRLPRVRDWRSRDAWVVSEVVLVFFGALTLAGLLG